jgi:hypothetical protein
MPETLAPKSESVEIAEVNVTDSQLIVEQPHIQQAIVVQSPGRPPFQLQTTLLVLFTIGVAAFVIAGKPEARTWALANIVAIAIALSIVVAGAIAIDVFRWTKRATARARAGLSIFLTAPLVLFLLGCVFLLSAAMQIMVIRSVFILAACLLPGTMYYLFIATKKFSLVNEYLTNLGRLGLPTARSLMPRSLAGPLGCVTEPERRLRVQTFLQRFEAVYGPIPPEYVDQIMEGTSMRKTPQSKSGQTPSTALTEVFGAEAAVPVILATVMITLGWLITLPPWEGSFVREATATVQLASAADQESAATVPSVAQQSSGDVESTQSDGNSPMAAAGQWASRWLAVLIPVRTPVRFAFIGAYFFCLQMLFRRYVRRDLRASAYISVWLRVLLAVMGIWVVESGISLVSSNPSATSQTGLLVVGFTIGVFPRVVWQFIESLAKRLFGLIVPSFQTQLPLSDIDGLTVWHEARLEEEDIENVPNLATADFVDLMLNTRIPPDRLIDWVDQAILYTHLGSEYEQRRTLLRAHGIYTASALKKAHDDSIARNEQTAFEMIIPFNGGRSPIRSIIDSLPTNCNLDLILKWRGLRPIDAI